MLAHLEATTGDPPSEGIYTSSLVFSTSTDAEKLTSRWHRNCSLQHCLTLSDDLLSCTFYLVFEGASTGPITSRLKQIRSHAILLTEGNIS